MCFALKRIQRTILSIVFCCPSKPTGATREGVNTRLFFFFFFNVLLPPEVFTSIFYREKGLAVPLVDSENEKYCHGALQLFTTFDRFEKTPTLAEIQTHELAARRLRGYQVDHRGDRLEAVKSLKDSSKTIFDINVDEGRDG